MSAMKSGMTRKTASKYLRKGNVMEQRQVPHTWRTREDPLKELWAQAVEMLRAAPELEAKALFEHLVPKVSGEIEEKQLRTFQRRVKSWRLAEGPEKEVFFTQDQKPGKTLAADWTDMGSLGITIQGKVLAHKLFHAVLPYSNWEWAVRAHSESMLSMRAGLKATLSRLGKVPQQILTDHSSAATHQLNRASNTRVFNEEYLKICEHYGLTPRTINVGRPNENGSCESSNGHLKRRIKQHLLLRGSSDFLSEGEYDVFLINVLELANRRRTKRLTEELATMGDLTIEDLADYREYMVSVRSNSTIRINKMVYSVPSRLIGIKLLARIYENHIVLLKGALEVAQLPLSRGDRGAVVDFRHVISHLLRKPGAFAEYRWREELFPSLIYRAAYDHLERTNSNADRCYLELLKLAADEGQTPVENALEQLMLAPRPVITVKEVKNMLGTWRDSEREWRDRGPLEVRLEEYDLLLDDWPENIDQTPVKTSCIEEVEA